MILRLTDDRSLLEIAGVLSDEETADLRDAIEERRERRGERLEEIADELREA